jgi:hypothetical protein
MGIMFGFNTFFISSVLGIAVSPEEERRWLPKSSAKF